MDDKKLNAGLGKLHDFIESKRNPLLATFTPNVWGDMLADTRGKWVQLKDAEAALDNSKNISMKTEATKEIDRLFRYLDYVRPNAPRDSVDPYSHEGGYSFEDLRKIRDALGAANTMLSEGGPCDGGNGYQGCVFVDGTCVQCGRASRSDWYPQSYVDALNSEISHVRGEVDRLLKERQETNEVLADEQRRGDECERELKTLRALRERLHNIGTGAETTPSDNEALILGVKLIEDSYAK